MKTYMPLNGLRWSRNSGSANCDMPQSAVFGRPGGVYNLLTTLGKEATSMWLIHTFISIYYWSGLTYSFQYPILIFLFVVICSYILSIAITMPYNIIRKRIESLFT